MRNTPDVFAALRLARNMSILNTEKGKKHMIEHNPADGHLWFNVSYRDPRQKRWIVYKSYKTLQEAERVCGELSDDSRVRGHELVYRVIKCEAIVQRGVSNDPARKVAAFLAWR